MIKIALFGKNNQSCAKVLQNIIDALSRAEVSVFIYKTFYEQCKSFVKFGKETEVFTEDMMPSAIDYVFTIGGDGTFLDALPLVKDSGIPVFGINTGRLGFLSNVNVNDFPKAIESILSGDFSLEQRMLLHCDHPACLNIPWALNDICIQRSGSNGMITIEVYIDNEHLNTYWCDGLIIATPTGSTAYSLGCGGPILTPKANAFVLTPIASHTLTVRPVVIPAESLIYLKITTRSGHFVINMDSNTYYLQSPKELTIKKEKFSIRIIRLKEQSFYKTLKEKLMWGLDRRN